ncbi:hypothetical protein PAHAL_7G180900 [Panicum hallii]|uniref:Uncharacterized protein n=1 Tax=Panicum hallii TaxID=206008 RepID=A0A2T8ICP8_9POAL|nr:hypothetical protein PAHAL_7G180900 [Panicum hallii]
MKRRRRAATPLPSSAVVLPPPPRLRRAPPLHLRPGVAAAPPLPRLRRAPPLPRPGVAAPTYNGASTSAGSSQLVFLLAYAESVSIRAYYLIPLSYVQTQRN